MFGIEQFAAIINPPQVPPPPPFLTLGSVWNIQVLIGYQGRIALLVESPLLAWTALYLVDDDELFLQIRYQACVMFIIAILQCETIALEGI